MKAVVIREPGGPEVLTVRDVDEPTIASDQCLVDVRATALNRADLLQRQGLYPAPTGVRDDIPGLECAGLVVETGRNVDRYEAGERVFGLLPGGGYARRVSVKADHLMPIPEPLSFEEAAAVPEVFLTAYDALIRQLDLKAGERVLIHAAGSGVGTAAVQIARVSGASLVLGTASQPKLNRVNELELGLDVGVDYRQTSFVEVVREQTDGTGVDVILDVVGADYWQDNLECLDRRGRLIQVGLLSGGCTEMEITPVLRKRLRIRGTVLRGRSDWEKTALIRSFEHTMLPLIEDERLVPVIHTIMDWEDVADAHRMMANDENTGKIVLILD